MNNFVEERTIYSIKITTDVDKWKLVISYLEQIQPLSLIPKALEVLANQGNFLPHSSAVASNDSSVDMAKSIPIRCAQSLLRHIMHWGGIWRPSSGAYCIDRFVIKYNKAALTRSDHPSSPLSHSSGSPTPFEAYPIQVIKIIFQKVNTPTRPPSKSRARNTLRTQQGSTDFCLVRLGSVKWNARALWKGRICANYLSKQQPPVYLVDA